MANNMKAGDHFTDWSNGDPCQVVARGIFDLPTQGYMGERVFPGDEFIVFTNLKTNEVRIRPPNEFKPPSDNWWDDDEDDSNQED